jgi:hypothetical protein
MEERSPSITIMFALAVIIALMMFAYSSRIE